jgi:predicted acyltransferase
MSEPNSPVEQPARLLSLDLFRGLVMFLLVAEGAGIYRALSSGGNKDGLLGSLLIQFTHHPWHGLRAWDLVQPAFMFIVGVAMVYSINKRVSQGDAWGTIGKHIYIRCLLLLAFGTGLHCIYAGEMVWILRNVLAQLAFTILFTFLIFRMPRKTQLGISIGLILLTDITYRVFSVEGFNNPYMPGENFGTWMDTVLRNPISTQGHWVAINAIPTTAHTIWGALVGRLLCSEKSAQEKLKILIYAGLGGLALGYLMNWGFGSDTLKIPIIKRICTGSFIYASGGWCLLILALFYYAIDLKGWKPKWLYIINVVGTNSIFIYLTAQLLGGRWLRPNVDIFSEGIFGSIGFSPAWVQLFTALGTWFILWYLCHWLYQRKIFLKI